MKNYSTFILEKFIESNLHREMPLPVDVLAIADRFINAGKDIFVVGGSVRDFLSGKNPHDFDMVTNAKPDEILHILGGYRADLQGKQFGVIRVFTPESPEGIEIASYRTDISKGRDNKSEGPKVDIENATMQGDAERRDLSINALYYDIKNKQIVDLVGGVDDLRNNIIRAVGIASKRFEEDRLRILRVVRFSARSGGKLDKKTKEAIIADNRLKGVSPIDDVSQERIMSPPNGEWYKMIEAAENANDMKMFMNYLKMLKDLNMFEQMLPDVKITIPKEELPSFKNGIIMAILLQENHTNQKFIEYLVMRMKIPYNVVKYFKYMSDFRELIKNPKNVVQLAKDKKRYDIPNNDLITYCDFMGIDKQYYKPFLKYAHDGFSTNGEELVARGFKGKEIQDEINRREVEIYKKNYLFIN